MVNTALRWPLTLHTGPLRCFVGLLCASTGALMLVAPHQFATPVYASIRPHLTLWGVGFVLAGVGLLALIGFSPMRAVRIGIDLFSAGILLFLGLGFALEGGVAGAVFFGVLGLATAFAAFVPAADRRATRMSRDLHIITVGAAALLIGCSMLLLPGQFGTSYATVRSILPVYGIAFLGSGGLLLFTQFSRPSPRGIFWLADFTAAATLFAFMIQTAIPQKAWTGVVLYGASATGLLVIPWLAPRFEHLEGTSHRVRIALALCAAATLPLITAVALYAPREEAVVARQVLALRQATAEGLALAWSRDTRSYEGSPASIARLIATADPGPHGRISVVDFGGRPVASYPEVLPDAAPSPLSSQLMREGTSGSLTYETNGHAWFAGYAAVGSNGWWFVVEQPATAALADVYGRREVAFGFLVLAAGLASIAGSWMAGRLAAPLHRAHQELHALNAGLEQRVLDRTGELESAVRELEAFSYSVSHDLRAPLRQIDGFSLALLEDYGQQLDKEGQDNLHWIRDGTQRMARLIDDLLKLSRITRTHLRSEPVDLSALAAEVTVGLRRAQPLRRINSSLESGLTAEGDRGLLLIVLENLLGNAWKFTRNELRGEVTFGAVLSAGAVAYFVRDNGAGFDMAYSDRLFGAFQRLHSEQEFEGTGIGLATVQRAVARHGGRVWAEGAVGEGATVWFTLAA